MTRQQAPTPHVPKPKGDHAAQQEADRLQTAMENVREGYDRPRGGDNANENAVETDAQRSQRSQRGSNNR